MKFSIQDSSLCTMKYIATCIVEFYLLYFKDRCLLDNLCAVQGNSLLAFWPSFVTAHTCTCYMSMEQLHDMYEYFLSTLTAQLSMGGGGGSSQ